MSSTILLPAAIPAVICHLAWAHDRPSHGNTAAVVHTERATPVQRFATGIWPRGPPLFGTRRASGRHKIRRLPSAETVDLSRPGDTHSSAGRARTCDVLAMPPRDSTGLAILLVVGPIRPNVNNPGKLSQQHR